MNFNGVSLESSPVYEYWACTAPSGFDAPDLVLQSETEIQIAWHPPNDTGGCRITSYAVYRDDGLGSVIDTEVNSDNDASVRDLPSLDTLTITNFPANSQGLTFRIQVLAITT